MSAPGVGRVSAMGAGVGSGQDELVNHTKNNPDPSRTEDPNHTIPTELREPILNTGLEGLLNVELAYGLRMRTQDADPQLVSIANGGKRSNSGNFDDGTLNYDQGDLTSNMLRTTGELTLRWGNFGAFLRG